MMCRYTHLIVGLLGCVFLPGQLNAQTLIVLENPSFEEEKPAHSQPPKGWFYCGPKGETPPDTHPNEVFPQELKPSDGHTYAGMVVRDNETWEALGQKLSSPLQAGTCYTFSVNLAIPVHFISFSRVKMQMTDFNNPIRLRLWGAERLCDKVELLAESPKLRKTKWQQYSFFFKPAFNANVLILEAFYDKEYSREPYNACVFIDNASPVFPIDCETKDTLAKVPQVLVPHIDSIADLKKLVNTYAPGLKLSASGNFIDQQLFTDAEGNLWHTNQALWMMAKALKQYPQAEITIWIDKKGEFNAKYLDRVAEQIEESLGLPSDFLLRINSGSPNAQDQEICWSDPEKKLYIRVVPR